MPLNRQLTLPGDMRTRPRRNDVVTIEYTGWILDPQKADSKGKQFDSTTTRGSPIEYTLGIGVVMKGWEQALPQMSLGEKSIWIMTSDLGYGETGLGRLIPPNSDLIFEIQLMAINGHKA